MTDLGKWPRLLVAGTPVTRAQANDILIRTNGWDWMTGNDREWGATVKRIAHDTAGMPIEPERQNYRGDDPEFEAYAETMRAHWDALHQWNTSMRILSLNYLSNARIYSSWIGGPHGWCNWDGMIGCSNYSIGKWPSVESVTEDWQALAAAFPYLDLRAQLVAEESEGDVAAEWRVTNGEVTVVDKPGDQILVPSGLEQSVLMAVAFRFTGRERGVSEERLAEALSQVAAASRA